MRKCDKKPNAYRNTCDQKSGSFCRLGSAPCAFNQRERRKEIAAMRQAQNMINKTKSQLMGPNNGQPDPISQSVAVLLSHEVRNDSQRVGSPINVRRHDGRRRSQSCPKLGSVQGQGGSVEVRQQEVPWSDQCHHFDLDQVNTQHSGVSTGSHARSFGGASKGSDDLLLLHALQCQCDAPTDGNGGDHKWVSRSGLVAVHGLSLIHISEPTRPY